MEFKLTHYLSSHEIDNVEPVCVERPGLELVSRQVHHAWGNRFTDRLLGNADAGILYGRIRVGVSVQQVRRVQDGRYGPVLVGLDHVLTGRVDSVIGREAISRLYKTRQGPTPVIGKVPSA